MKNPGFLMTLISILSLFLVSVFTLSGKAEESSSRSPASVNVSNIPSQSNVPTGGVLQNVTTSGEEGPVGCTVVKADSCHQFDEAACNGYEAMFNENFPGLASDAPKEAR